MNLSNGSQRRLIWHGMVLFFAGLLVGLAEGQFANPRMGLAAHLEGLMNGTYLIALGAVWSLVSLSPRLTNWAFWTVTYGPYSNLIITTYAAIVGANSMSPITGAVHGASALQETLVTLGFVSVGMAMLVSSVLILWGLRLLYRPPFTHWSTIFLSTPDNCR
jgi:hydroxylaminobenzene mutase